MEVKDIITLQDADLFIKECIRKLGDGLMDKTEFMEKMKAYTMHIIVTSEEQRQTLKKMQDEKLV